MKYSLVILFILLSNTMVFGQKNKNYLEAEKYQQKLNEEFAEKQKSPLTEEDFQNFKTLSFFEINLKYRIKANFVKNQFPVPFEMPTTTNRKPIYQKYGTLYFELDGVKCELNVFQNMDLIKKEEYKNLLFLPFTDLSNGEESYGGGRYLDLELPFVNTVILDFNKAYNPYCAYNGKYSCPIVPKENRLNVSIKAGVKKFH